jgi:glycosyltransferase involved in cell wall biosynthesis
MEAGVTLTVLHLITGLDTGGAERMLARLVARTDHGRFQPLVVSLTDAGTLGPIIRAGGGEVATLGLCRGLPDPRGIRRLAAMFRQLRPDIVHSWLYHADLLGLLAFGIVRTPRLLWNLRCSDMGTALAPLTVLCRGVLGKCSGIPDAVVVNSLAGLRFHERIGYHPRRWEYVPNGFDMGEFHFDPEARRALRAELGIGDATIAIGLPARYHPMKDHATFLAAAARLASTRPDTAFVLVGRGIDGANHTLAAAIAAHGLWERVRLLGDRRDIARVYSALDIVTLSSAGGEGFSNVLGEAMACSVPCAATDDGDARTIIGETGIVVPRRDPAALAAGLAKLIALGGEGRRALGAAARTRIAREFDIASVVAHYEALYEDIIAQPRARPAMAGGH